MDPTETGRMLAEAAEEAAKAMQEFADLLRREEEEYDRQKFWRYHVEKLGAISPEELIRARATTDIQIEEEIVDALCNIGEIYPVFTDDVNAILSKREEVENGEAEEG